MACAATCADGVVVATDSIRLYFAAPQNIVTLERKMQSIGERIFVAKSGTFRGEPRYVEAAAFAQGSGLNVGLAEAAWLVRRELERQHAPELDPREPGDDYDDIPDVYEALIAGGPLSETPQLIVVRQGEPDAILEPGRIVMTGCMRSWCRERGLEVSITNPATNVVAAAAEVVALMYQAATDLYARYGKRQLSDFFPDGIEPGKLALTPPVAFPVHLAVITAAGVTVLSVPEPAIEPAAIAGSVGPLAYR